MGMIINKDNKPLTMYMIRCTGWTIHITRYMVKGLEDLYDTPGKVHLYFVNLQISIKN